MRKTIAIILFLITAAFCFAETGYNGYEWGTSRESLDFGEVAEEWDIMEGTSLVSYSSQALGQFIVKTLIFYNGNFDGVSYLISNEDIADIETSLGKKVYEVNVELFTNEDLPEVIKDNAIEFPEYAYESEETATLAAMIFVEAFYWTIMSEFEMRGYKSIPATNKKTSTTEGIATISIFNYNSDTRIYFINGNLEGLACLVFLHHYSDL